MKHSDISEDAVHYKPTTDRIEQVAKQHTVKKKGEKKLKKDWQENAQLLAKFKTYQPAFFEMFEEFKSEWDWHLRRINMLEKK